MKHLSTALVLLAGLGLTYVATRAGDPTYVLPGEGTGVPSVLPEALPAGHLVRRFEVEGMCSCSGCPPKLYQALLAVDGVASAAIDPELGLAEVQMIAGTDPDLIVAALTFEDYTARALAEQ